MSKKNRSAEETMQYGIAQAIAQSFKKPTETEKAMTSLIKMQAAFNILEEGSKLIKDQDNDIRTMDDYFVYLESAAKRV